MASHQDSATPHAIFLPFSSLVVCIFLWPALLTFHPGDWPSPNQFPHNEPASNACGVVGSTMAYYLRHYLGDGVYPLLLFATLAAIMKLVRGTLGSVLERIVGLALVVACTSASAHLISTPGTAALPAGHGGIFGHVLGELMSTHLSRLGTLIVIASSFFVGLLFATEGWVLKLPAMIKRAGEATSGAVTVARQAVTSVASVKPVTVAEGLSRAERRGLFGRMTDEEELEKDADKRRSKAVIVEDEPLLPEEPESENDEEDDDEYEYEYVYEYVDEDEGEEDEDEEEDDDEVVGESPEESEDDDEPAPDEGIRAEKIKQAAKVLAGPKVNFASPENTAQAEPYPRQIENWPLPDLDLLLEPEYGFTQKQETLVREQARILEQTLEEFRLDARVVEIDTGPVITMFELSLGAGIKVSQIASLSNDIARALKAHAIRVVAPITGKNTVGIEVPNLEKEMVRLKELMTLAGKRASQMALPLFLGKDAGGAPLVSDLAKMPHVLIAGTTGSGKSVCINSIILSLLMTKRPDHVKMILVDPKMVEMSQFKEVPHLMCPIVTDMNKAERILEWAVTTMEERYALLAEVRVKNIGHYNSLGEEKLLARLNPENEEERSKIITHLPYIVIIIDELADLMMTSAKEVEHHLSRLAQKSRAVGVHIVVATQRPEARVVTGLIKSNLPSRVCFRVASRMDSRIVLDQNGGEVLMGQGDMLFLPPGSHKLMRSQGTYLAEDEVQAVLDDLSARAKPEFHPALMRIKAPGQEGSLSVRDPLFNDAVKIVLESRRGSVSLLQRRLTIGYSRASRLIDQMSEAGIVGEYKGSQAREVEMTLEEWEALQAQVVREQNEGYAADEEDEDDEIPPTDLFDEPGETSAPF
ncbi:MAG: FtsK/SpoIIIE family DNA translocase [Planctomycetota bacterium]|jgi:S-DNA-T family DNA segregation ATPase FtsK/SpoIIIE